jgi:hypothetical protein
VIEESIFIHLLHIPYWHPSMSFCIPQRFVDSNDDFEECKLLKRNELMRRKIFDAISNLREFGLKMGDLKGI